MNHFEVQNIPNNNDNFDEIVEQLRLKGYGPNHIGVVQDVDVTDRRGVRTETTYFQVCLIVSHSNKAMVEYPHRHAKKFSWAEKHLAYRLAADFMEALL